MACPVPVYPPRVHHPPPPPPADPQKIVGSKQTIRSKLSLIKGLKDGPFIRDLRGYLGVIWELHRYMGTL